MQKSKQHLFTLAFVGCLLLALVLGCSSLKEKLNTGQTASPEASPAAAADDSPLTGTSPDTAGSPASTTGVTMANFNRLKTGMTYAEVVEILGKEGKENGELGSKETTGFKITVYQWDADGGSPNAKIDAFFKDGKLDKKFQFDLK